VRFAAVLDVSAVGASAFAVVPPVVVGWFGAALSLAFVATAAIVLVALAARKAVAPFGAVIAVGQVVLTFALEYREASLLLVALVSDCPASVDAVAIAAFASALSLSGAVVVAAAVVVWPKFAAVLPV